ncbi:hypothetical protein Q8A64_06600 [Oxalobacteraceae bacterium R-40]|uniref:Uncharacterized protein n=1 Tax=Keguizhuia sedimenti TaxID=3064264 RepID=A0ABU1BM69_9BURK|nr:hypothetical protein [Oxalobacteraceae bacterium R-40]
MPGKSRESDQLKNIYGVCAIAWVRVEQLTASNNKQALAKIMAADLFWQESQCIDLRNQFFVDKRSRTWPIPFGISIFRLNCDLFPRLHLQRNIMWQDDDRPAMQEHGPSDSLSSSNDFI